MTEVNPNGAVKEAPKIPGIVIFVAVLNFISMAFFFFLSTLSLIVLVFGNVMGIYDFITKKITAYRPQINVSIGFNVFFILALVFGIIFFVFYLVEGIGLLRGKKYAWYFQVALSVLGLLGFPIGTVLNAVILIFFFQSSIRGYFKV